MSEITEHYESPLRVGDLIEWKNSEREFYFVLSCQPRPATLDPSELTVKNVYICDVMSQTGIIYEGIHITHSYITLVSRLHNKSG